MEASSAVVTDVEQSPWCSRQDAKNARKEKTADDDIGGRSLSK